LNPIHTTKTTATISAFSFFISHLSRQRLIALAEYLHSIRDFQRLAIVAESLTRLSSAGYYYEALAVKNCGAGDIPRSGELLETGLRQSSPGMTSRFLLSLGANVATQYSQQEAMPIYLESLKRARDAWSYLEASRMIAVAKASNGDHGAALRQLESLVPAGRLAAKDRPEAILRLQNSLAIESLAVGQADRAVRLMEGVIRSPWAAFYPEYAKTYQDALESTRQGPLLAVGTIFEPLDYTKVSTGQSVAYSQSKRGRGRPKGSGRGDLPASERQRKAKIAQAFSMLYSRDVSKCDAMDFMRALNPTPYEIATGVLIATEERVTEPEIDAALAILEGAK
jgi:hypothetical protein